MSTSPAAPIGRIIAVLGACGFASTFTMRLLDPIVPELALEFQRPLGDIAIFSTGFALSYALSQPILGPFGDAIGKTRMIRFSVFALAGLLLLTSFSSGYSLMFFLRAVSGAVGGGIIPLALAAIGDAVPLAERQIAIGRFLAMIILGQMMGATASGFVADHFGWRAVFVLAALMALAAGTLATLFLPSQKEASGTMPQFGPVMRGYRGIFANPRTVPLYLLVMVEGAVAYGFFPYIAGILGERAGTGPSEAGLVIGMAGVGGILYAIMVRRIVHTLGVRLMTRLGGILMGLSLLAFSLELPWWTALGLFFVHGFSFYLLHNNLQTYSTELSTTHRGAAVGLFAASFFVGNGLGPAMFGALYHFIGAASSLIAYGCALIIIGLAAPALLGISQRPR
ncbi:MFS transporter [Candidatus Raskinella chloraquaticus]|uniref:Major facilitator superfamily (MFS) profile domain-containing protein n=1 Tax=Candidatus Raskinella chloraquaticus TaxID=1951219 RepID=A0A1W9HZL0_9HYPH|nr:MAG: hypothetical protein A4S15_05945 [Proteobacteria bacterium SG_bin8]